MITMLLYAVFLLGTAADPLNDSATVPQGRELCGPLAVQTVLRHLGKDVPVSELAERTFSDSSAHLSSLAALSECLKHRGVHTLPVDLGRNNRIDLPQPVIIHLSPSPRCPSGHFAVVLPAADREDNRQLVWLSPGVMLYVPWRDLSGRRSRVVLITSATPIDRDEALRELSGPVPLRRWSLLLGTGALLIACLYNIGRKGNADED